MRVAENDDPTQRSDAARGAADPHGPTSLVQTFQQQYDDLGPVDFAKRVIEFGDWLGRASGSLSPDETERALAEYSFLQDRLSFWLSYDYKPPAAEMNLISAALTLYQGAINGGFARAGDLPQSMLDVGGAAWAFDNIPSRSRPSTQPDAGEAAPPSIQPPKELEGLSGIVDNSQTNIGWGKGLKDQNGKWEDYYGRENPDVGRLRPRSTTFDFFDDATGEAISNKTLNTLSVSYINDPQQIYNKVAGYSMML